MSELEAGYGYIDGKPMYYEQEGDHLQIFPNGIPRGHHTQMPHDHITADGPGVTYMREGDELINNYRQGQGS